MSGAQAAVLTPAGAGAIAALAVRGPAAWTILRSLVRPELPVTPPAPGTARVARLGDGQASDEVVLVVRSLEPAPWVEVHAHGGRAVVAWILELLAAAGAANVSAEEFVGDPLQGELARALTARTARIVLDQSAGAFRAAVARIPAEGRALVDRLLGFAMLGRRLTTPWRVAVVGAPNVGKSSLVNALAGFQRSIVAPIPGTTRDAVTTQVACDGWPVELIDTAGLRDADDTLERAGVERARATLAGADLAVWVVDVTRAAPPEPPGGPGLIVANKGDLPQAHPIAADATVSALTGAGVAGLATMIATRLVPVAPNQGEAVPVLAPWVAGLERVKAALEGKSAESPTAALAALESAAGASA